MKLIDLTGARFDRLVVLRRATKHPRRTLWDCRCDCGNECTVDGGKLRSCHTRSCGCLQRQVTTDRNLQHGHAGTPTHIVWLGMIARCENPRNKSYRHYGARGIAVCDRWHRFANFLADMGERPHGLTIERVDTNGNYEPGNCRWATQKEQQRNRRNNRIIVYGGEALTLAEWSERLGASHGTIDRRLRHGWSIERAITEPIMSPNKGV